MNKPLHRLPKSLPVLCTESATDITIIHSQPSCASSRPLYLHHTAIVRLALVFWNFQAESSLIQFKDQFEFFGNAWPFAECRRFSSNAAHGYLALALLLPYPLSLSHPSLPGLPRIAFVFFLISTLTLSSLRSPFSSPPPTTTAPATEYQRNSILYSSEPQSMIFVPLIYLFFSLTAVVHGMYTIQFSWILH